MNIPDRCFALNNMTINPQTKVGEVIEIRALESGYYRTIQKKTQEEVDAMNEALGVTQAEARAMADCSVFNWEMYPNLIKRYQEYFAKQEAELEREIIQAGIDNPLPESEATALVSKIVKKIQTKGSKSLASNLQGDPDEIARGIVSKRRAQ